MNKLTIIAFFSMALLGISPAIAQQSTQGTQAAPMTRPYPPPGASANVGDFDKRAAKVQENIRKMQEQMTAIHNAKDAEKRQKLLQEHWETMQSSMSLMQEMWGPGMMMGQRGMPNPRMAAQDKGRMGPMMGWQGMGRFYSDMTPEQMQQHQYMRDQYMNMQHQMMDQMMQHQHQMWNRQTQ